MEKIKSNLQMHMYALIFLWTMLFSTFVFAHGEQLEVSTGVRGPVHLSPNQAKTIELQTTDATQRPLASILPLNGEIKLLPDSQADVTVRISGQVTGIYANLGDLVIAGQRLAKIQSRLVGDPPPSVTITAPIKGIIDARNVNIGQSVEPSTVLFHISNREKMLMLANVYEEDLGKIKVGQIARVRVISYPNKIFPGQVIRIEPNLDSLTRTLKMWIILDNPQDLLKPNLFGSADVILKENNSALAVPNAAVIEAEGEKFVFVQEGDTYHRTVVKTGASDDRYTEIVDGLVPGDKVVTQGNHQLYTLWLTGNSGLESEE